MSSIEVTEGGEVSEEVREAVRIGDMGRETTWVAKVIAEIHREDSRGSSEDGNRAQNLHIVDNESKILAISNNELTLPQE